MRHLNVLRVSGIILASLASFPAARATHTGNTLEIGPTSGAADILGSAAAPGCDWADLFDATPTAEEANEAARTCGGVAAAFIRDPLGAADTTVFKGGASKNDAPPSAWQWGSGTVPGKDDLSNFYTYAALDENGHLILHAAVERVAPGGDSHVDFEFNQAGVRLDRSPPCGSDGTDGPTDGAPCEFVGEKSEGDLLLVMDFRKGGAIGFVEVRRWDGTQYALLESVGGEGCSADDLVCAFNNAVSIDGGPWPNFNDKGQVVTNLPANAFTEISVDVTALLGRTPCFVTLTAKTRTSSSFTSSLKDFARTEFGICSLTLDKSGASSNPDPDRSKLGDAFTFQYDITNTGAGTLYLRSVTDSLLGDITSYALGATATLTGTVDGRVIGTDAAGSCGVLVGGQGCSFTVPGAVPEDEDDPFETTASTEFGDFPGFGFSGLQSAASLVPAPDAGLIVSVSADDIFSLNLFQPSVDVEMASDATSAVGETSTTTVTVTNTSSADSPDLANGLITDTLLGDLLDPANPLVVSSDCATTLPVGGSCTIVAERVVAAGDPDPLTHTVSVRYNPAGGYPNLITDSAEAGSDLVQPDAALALTSTPSAGQVGDSIVYSLTLTNTGNVTLERVSVTDTLLGDLTALFPASLAPGASVTVTVTRAITGTDPDPLVNTTTAVYRVGSLEGLVTAVGTTSVDITIPCALSPGFWKGGNGIPKWDQAGDPIAVAAGFTTGTVFPWLHSSLTGTTYLGVLDLGAGGDVTRQLSFKDIAARLNEAVFGVSAGTAALLDAIDVYLAANPVGSNPQGAASSEGTALLDALNAYFVSVGESSCPAPDAF